MADFAQAYAQLCVFEGGYANNPNDRGGETWGGISRVSHPKWKGWAIIDAAKTKPNFPKSLDTNQELIGLKKELYKQVYWNFFSLDSCPNQMIADELFDTSVNMGTGTAVRFLQASLAACSILGKNGKQLSVDGSYGDNSKFAFDKFFTQIRKDRHIVLYKMLNSLQGSRYIDIAVNKPSQQEFTFGWFTRVFEHYKV